MAVPDGMLADPAELSAWLGVPADDPKLLAALKAASRRFIDQVRHPVVAVNDDQVVLDGDGTDRLLLKAAPVTAVTAVRLAGADADLVDGVDYEWSADGIVRRVCGTWPDQYRAVSLTYSHGYATIPEGIQEVVIDQARAMHPVLAGVQTMQAGGESITYGLQATVGVTAQWTAAVERYRLNLGDDA